MKKCLALLVVTLAFINVSPAWSSPKEDLDLYRKYFEKRFPDVSWQDYANGVYAVDPIARENWEAIEEFPPYELAIEDGQELFEIPFENGKSYADCFPNKGISIRQRYPYWDKARGEVVTLALALNECRVKHGEEPLPYSKGKIAAILSYMAFTSRGQKIQIDVPKDDPGALAAYEAGKNFYFARRGQLNFSCAHCHMMFSGAQIRSEKLSPALGHATSWPTYRAKWGEMGTLHRRFRGCNKQVRAKPLKAQSVAYRNLEYFLYHMSNDLDLNGPAARR